MTALKTKARDLWQTFLEGLLALSTLVKMQLKEKMDLSYMRSTRKLIFKLCYLVIEFAAITAAIAVAFYFVQLLGLFSLVRDIPVSVISIIFSLMLGLSLVTDTVGLMKSLYFAKDNSVLLTFPATPSLVFFSKLATYYIYELRKSFMFTIPLFIAYGIIKGYALYYYPWLLFMFLLISTIPVLIAALLSIPAMYLYVFLSRLKVLQYTLYAIIGAIGVLLVWSFIGMIPEDINFIESWGETYWEIQAFLSGYTKTFAPLYAFTELIVGKTVGLKSIIFHEHTLLTLLILLAISALALLLCFLCSKPLFCRMAATPFEFKKKNSLRQRKNRARRPFSSALHKEWLSGVRSNTFVRLTEILILVMPLAIYLLNKIYSAMNTRFLGTQMTLCFNILIILLILLMTNIDLASIYSRDGSSAYLNKVQPTSYATLLFSKLVYPMVIALIGTAISVSIFSIFTTLAVFDTVMIGATIYGIYLAHLFWSAESDIMNPQYEQYATFNEQANNPNETVSAILAIILSFITFVISLFLSSEATTGVWAKIAAVAVALAAFKAFTYFAKIKAFYKEKQ